MTLTYSEWKSESEAPPPPSVAGMRPARDSHHLRHSPRDRFLSALVTVGGQVFVAGLVLIASMNAIAPKPEAQTITVAINQTTQQIQPLEPPPVEQVRVLTPTMPAPEILIQTPPSANAPTFIAAPPPPPAPPPQQKVVQEAPVTPPNFDAAYLKNPAVYPNMSRRLREVGTVQLRVRVSASGQPLEILLAKSSGYARLDEAALSAVRKWTFQPALRSGDPIEAWVLVPLEFSLTNG